MFPFQHRELLTKGQVFEKESATSTDKPKNRTCQESDGTYHARVLAYFPCGRQCRILLKSQADRFLARDNRRHSTSLLQRRIRDGSVIMRRGG